MEGHTKPKRADIIPESRNILLYNYGVANVIETWNSHANDPIVLKKVAKTKKQLSRVKLPDCLKK